MPRLGYLKPDVHHLNVLPKVDGPLQWDFFDSATIPLGRLRPRQELVDAGYCLAEPGKTYLVYLENGGKVNVDVAPGSYEVTWINAANTADQRDGGPTNDGRGLTAPDLSDWLVLLRLPR